MIVLVEGADLVGKGTLIDRLRAIYPWPVVKVRWTPDRDRRSETVGIANATIAMLRGLAPDVILDRCYFTPWAYDDDDREYMTDLIARFDQVSSVVPCRLLVLTASRDELIRRHEREPHHKVTLDRILVANERYRHLPEVVPPSLPALLIDTTATAPDEVCQHALAFLSDGVEFGRMAGSS